MDCISIYYVFFLDAFRYLCQVFFPLSTDSLLISSFMNAVGKENVLFESLF